MVSDAEVTNFLSHPENVVGHEYNLAHILFRAPEGASPEQLARLPPRPRTSPPVSPAAEAFDKLAASYPTRSDALSGGNNIGWRSAERLPGLFAEAVANLRPGEVTLLLRSAAGFHLVKLIERKGAAAPAQVQQTHARHILISRPARWCPTPMPNAAHRPARARRPGRCQLADLARQHSADISAAKGAISAGSTPVTPCPIEQAMDAPARRTQPARQVAPLLAPHLVENAAFRMCPTTAR